jgi:UDP-hydrolysing UDP-N-acetyl-D-glucosamine 2-epimerase
MRKIAVVTGSRAEYGLLYWIIKGIQDNPELELQLIVTGTHLANEFGFTIQEIHNDAFPIAEKVELLLSSDSPNSISASMGLGLIGFAKAYERLKPDIIVVLGDRFEIFSAVAAAIPFRIPVAHIHGGEITEGAMDDLFRHAITKMSHIHFPANTCYADRIIQMGEPPERIFCFGAPGLDNIKKLKLLNKKKLAAILGLPLEKSWGILTYHPVTLEKGTAQFQILEILEVLGEFKEIFWVITMPNADTESRIIISLIKEFAKENPRKSKLFTSLGTLNYLSLMKYLIVMVGNSSSGIIEAPSFQLPVVNIGSRQKGRIQAKNVVDVPVCKKNTIKAGIKKAISKGFRNSLEGNLNPYGEGDVSDKIVAVLKGIPLSDCFKKKFTDLQFI